MIAMDESEVHIVLSDAEPLMRTAAELGLAPRVLPNTATRIDPVAAALVSVTVSREAMSNDKAWLLLEALSPVVTRKESVLPVPTAVLMCRQVSDNHVEPSALVMPVAVDMLGNNRPLPNMICIFVVLPESSGATLRGLLNGRTS